MNTPSERPNHQCKCAKQDRRSAPDQRPDQRSDQKPDACARKLPAPTSGVLDRRLGVDRRDLATFAAEQGASGADDFSGLERRRGPGRRRSDFMKAAEEGEMTAEQFYFLSAVESFKKANGKMFPTWTDVLEVVRLIGYRKTMASEISLRNAEDWREKSDTPSGVRCKPGHPEERRAAA